MLWLRCSFMASTEDLELLGPQSGHPGRSVCRTSMSLVGPTVPPARLVGRGAACLHVASIRRSCDLTQLAPAARDALVPLEVRGVSGGVSADLPRRAAAKLVRDHESLGHGA